MKKQRKHYTPEEKAAILTSEAGDCIAYGSTRRDSYVDVSQPNV